MCELDILHDSLYQFCPELHLKRLNNLTLACHALLESKTLTLTELGRNLPTKARTKHNIKRIDRLLGNRHLHKERLAVYRWHAGFICSGNPIASQLLQRTLMREQCFNQPLVLHSDNGAPMKSLTFKAKMDELGITSSYSRPRVSDDNPYVESLFRTVKYMPNWPTKGFETIESSRGWVEAFVRWYNTEHKHSKINYVTPSERHSGKDKEILKRRAEVLLAAKKRKPERWPGDIRNCKPVGDVHLNPER